MKLSKKKMQELLDEWADAKQQEATLLAEQDAKIAPYLVRFENKAQPIRESFTELIRPLQERAGEIEKLVAENLLSDLNEDGSVRVVEVATEAAKAQVMTTAQRTIEPSTFFDLIPAPARDKSFWGCVTIGIQKAEKFLGSRIDAIAKKKFSNRVQLIRKED